MSTDLKKVVSPEEQADLDQLALRTRDTKLKAYDLMYAYMGMGPEMLKHSGHASVESALKYAMERAIKEVNKLTKDFLKRWPD